MFNTDPVVTRDATSDDALLFTRSASSGYLEGMQAMLKAGLRFSHMDWVDALEEAAHGAHKNVLRFVLRQLVAHGADIIPDNEWHARVKHVNAEMLPDVEAAEHYVRAGKVREKLRHKGIFAAEVPLPHFIKDAEKTEKYEFCKDRESDIVGDHSQRRRHKMEVSAGDRESERSPNEAWLPIGGDFAPATAK
jgi:hypothetical protein